MPGIWAVSPADEGATSRLARFGQAAQELPKDGRLEFAGRDVVEKKQRSRAEHRDIVDAMVDEVLPDGVVTADRKGNFQFCANTINTGHENRSLHSLEIRAEEPPKSADFAEHLRSVGRADNRLNPALECVAKIDVHTGLSVGLYRARFHSKRACSFSSSRIRPSRFSMMNLSKAAS